MDTDGMNRVFYNVVSDVLGNAYNALNNKGITLRQILEEAQPIVDHLFEESKFTQQDLESQFDSALQRGIDEGDFLSTTNDDQTIYRLSEDAISRFAYRPYKPWSKN